MSEMFRDFDKKNEMPKVKIPKFATGGICNDAIFPKLDVFSQIDEIVKDIRDRQDNVMAMEFTKCIGELLRKNGVVPKITEYTRNFETDKTFETRYGVSIDELDFTEHDNVFEDKIGDLLEQNRCLREENEKMSKLINHRLGDWDKCGMSYEDIFNMQDENESLKKRVEEFESLENEKCVEEPIKDCSAPNIEWYENRHQSDCIEINRLNTTIDVLIHKIEYLRQFAGLE